MSVLERLSPDHFLVFLALLTDFSRGLLTLVAFRILLTATLSVAYSSDRSKERAFHIAAPACLAGLMYALSLGIKNHTAQYIFLCFGLGGTWTALPIVLAWTPTIIAYPNEKRGLAQAFVNMVANLAPIYGAYLWPASDAPRCCDARKISHGQVPYTFDFERWGAEAESEEVVIDDEKASA
ncbi:hypothetical protein DFH09DRAFT_1345227 [Mycena vulgaris]|nr:hypothetical protein DFH09DRAFT_1345227 [Mycena vulgaris]